jgi:TonB family protein
MKKLLALYLFFLSNAIFSQVNDSTVQIIDPIESMPTYPGGPNSLFCSIEKNLNYQIINFTDIKAKYFIRFTIDTIGKPFDFEFIATVPQLDHSSNADTLIRNEIRRVLKLLTNWNPALLDGKKVPCRFVLQFKIPYTQFKCDEIKKYKNIEYDPDLSADFNEAKGVTRLDRINNYLNTNIRWPSQADVQGRVVIKCIVEKSGSLRDFEFIRRLDPDFDAEAMRVVKEMPKWSPAIKNNKPVRSIIVIPIKFVMH